MDLLNANRNNTTDPGSAHLHYWREIRNEMLVRIQEACPREDISLQPKILYFCDQLAFRICKLKRITQTTSLESVLITIQGSLNALLDLPMDVITYHPHIRSQGNYPGDLDTRELLRAVRGREKPS